MPDPEMLETCGADVFQGLVGQSGQIADLLTFPEDRMVRVIRPGTIITMDLRADRINFEIDEDDVIFRVRCG
ncbi:hypothetical protein HKCCE2091_17095 [Rhodobacterales bacterium HKCCE2091]|nr:hypothetical protein [Rhodobacterales bacterium HKCCE2091]